MDIQIGDWVKHRRDGYIGKVVDFDNVFVRLEDGRSMLKYYAEVLNEKEE